MTLYCTDTGISTNTLSFVFVSTFTSTCSTLRLSVLASFSRNGFLKFKPGCCDALEFSETLNYSRLRRLNREKRTAQQNNERNHYHQKHAIRYVDIIHFLNPPLRFCIARLHRTCSSFHCAQNAILRYP